jgi:hypothetical protein
VFVQRGFPFIWVLSGVLLTCSPPFENDTTGQPQPAPISPKEPVSGADEASVRKLRLKAGSSLVWAKGFPNCVGFFANSFQAVFPEVCFDQCASADFVVSTADGAFVEPWGSCQNPKVAKTEQGVSLAVFQFSQERNTTSMFPLRQNERAKSSNSVVGVSLVTSNSNVAAEDSLLRAENSSQCQVFGPNSGVAFGVHTCSLVKGQAQVGILVDTLKSEIVGYADGTASPQNAVLMSEDLAKLLQE